jgi:2-keto-4-pentenoate hydratase/2-oxohepta-3-ene-1,7-dioic acid hydratase in catechol pathway
VKIVRVRTEGDEIAYGVAEAEGITLYRGTPFVAWEPTESVIPFQEAQLLSPVFPTKVICVGRNYAQHADELGNPVPDEPLIGVKPATAVIGPGAPIVLPAESGEVHHEAELAVVVGKVSHRVAAEDAAAHILGYTAGNDVTARDLQRKDGQWARAKGFDTFCPLGPAIETELDPAGLRVSCEVNGELRQEGTTDDMVFGVAELFSFISGVMTLLPGDVILTGTPSGVGAIQAGDRVDVTVERIGTLANPVVAGS